MVLTSILNILFFCPGLKTLAVQPLPPHPPCSSGGASLSSSVSFHPLFSSSPRVALHPSAEHRYLFRNLGGNYTPSPALPINTQLSWAMMQNSSEFSWDSHSDDGSTDCKARLLQEVDCTCIKPPPIAPLPHFPLPTANSCSNMD